MSWTPDIAAGLAGLASTIGAVAVGTLVLVAVAQLAVVACRRWGACG